MSGAGLVYVAENGPTGYAESGERLVTALRDQGVPVAHQGLSGTAEHRNRHIVRNDRERPGIDAVSTVAATVAHLVPEHYPGLRRLVGAAPLVGHTVWETDRPPDHWPALLNDTDGLIVPTTWNREVFSTAGVTVPTEVVPHIACAPDAGDRGEPLGLADDVIVFYTISRWGDRKAPWLVVEAFLDAFTSEDPVALVVKTGELSERRPSRGPTGRKWSNTVAVEIARMLSRHRRPPPIQVAVDDWPPDRIAGLHHRGDCFVSLTRGEGWGLGAFDACAYGNPVVMTGWGGQLAYLDPTQTRLVDHTLVPVVHPAPASYSPEQHWAEPSHGDAVEALRELVADPTGHRRRAAAQAERVRRDFSPAVVADRFLDALTAFGVDRASLTG